MPASNNRNDNTFKLISGFLNSENNLGIGTPLAYGSLSGSLVPQYAGMLGNKITFSEDDAAKSSNPTVGTCYDGTYQLVRIAPAAVATNNNLTRGRLVFWDTTAAVDVYQVTNDETQNGGQPLYAGVLLNTVTPGNYTIIQVGGRASVQCRATVTAATRDLVWSAAGAGADNATFDGLAGATAVSGANVQKQLAMSEAVAANAALVVAFLSPMWFVSRN